MLLPAAAARRFIDGYKQVAVSVHALLELPLSEDPRQVVRAARERICEEPALLGRAIAQLERRGRTPDPEVLDALGQLRLDRWVHLKDLKRGAILLDLDGREA